MALTYYSTSSRKTRKEEMLERIREGPGCSKLKCLLYGLRSRN